MASRFEKGKSVYFLFRDGYTVQDSQLKPRYYLTREMAESRLRYGSAEIVEYAPAVHGKWIEPDNLDDGFWKCSQCGFLSEAHAANRLYRYCPNCGAKMDGGYDGVV